MAAATKAKPKPSRSRTSRAKAPAAAKKKVDMVDMSGTFQTDAAAVHAAVHDASRDALGKHRLDLLNTLNEFAHKVAVGLPPLPANPVPQGVLAIIASITAVAVTQGTIDDPTAKAVTGLASILVPLAYLAVVTAHHLVGHLARARVSAATVGAKAQLAAMKAHVATAPLHVHVDAVTGSNSAGPITASAAAVANSGDAAAEGSSAASS